MGEIHEVIIDSDDDPSIPGRTVYRITASTREAVQSAIDKLMNAPDIVKKDFFEPFQIDKGLFGSLGYTQRQV